MDEAKQTDAHEAARGAAKDASGIPGGLMPSGIPKDELRRRARSAWWVVGIACLLGLSVLGAKWVRYKEILRIEHQAEANLRQVELGVRAYKVEHGAYPPSTPGDTAWFDAVVAGERGQPPIVNPYNGEPVRLVTFAKHSAGDVTYIDIPAGDYGGERANDSYYLLTYCGKEKMGYDINGDYKADAVLLVLDSGHGNSPQEFPAELDTVWKAIQWSEGDAAAAQDDAEESNGTPSG